jgi:hypothetical protein
MYYGAETTAPIFREGAMLMSRYWWLPDEELMPKISKKTLTVLKSLAEGQSYDQLLTRFPDLDISAAAREALTYIETNSISNGVMNNSQADDLLKRYPRSNDPWDDNDDKRLSGWFMKGVTVDDIAGKLKRAPQSIRNRLKHLGLLKNQGNGDMPRVMIQNID